MAKGKVPAGLAAFQKKKGAKVVGGKGAPGKKGANSKGKKAGEKGC